MLPCVAVIAMCVALTADAQSMLQRMRERREARRQASAENASAATSARATAPAKSAAADDDNADGLKRVDPGGSAIEFRDSPLDVVFLKYGELVGKTVLVDPAAPKVNITLQPLTGIRRPRRRRLPCSPSRDRT